MSEPRNPPSEKIRLRDEARYLSRQIRKAQALLKQREQVKRLKTKLEDLRHEIEHPGCTFRD